MVLTRNAVIDYRSNVKSCTFYCSKNWIVSENMYYYEYFNDLIEIITKKRNALKAMCSALEHWFSLSRRFVDFAENKTPGGGFIVDKKNTIIFYWIYIHLTEE